MIASARTLISTGTERMLVEFGRYNPFGDAPWGGDSRKAEDSSPRFFRRRRKTQNRAA